VCGNFVIIYGNSDFTLLRAGKFYNGCTYYFTLVSHNTR